MYDIIIIGAGPAGATLAKLLNPMYKILLLDSRNDSNGCNDCNDGNESIHKHKCCGGLLAPDAQRIIAQMGLGIPKEILVDPQLFNVRVIDLKYNIERDFQRFYINMDRDKFDEWLIDMVPAHVTKVFNVLYKSSNHIPQGVEVTYWDRTSGQEKKAICRLLVGADGAQSKVRNTIEKKPLDHKYIAIQEWFLTSKHMPYFTAIFDPENTDFYGWTIPKDGKLLFGVALRPGKDAREKYENIKCKLIARGFPLEQAIRTEGAFIQRPQSLSNFNPGKGNIALIGEAAGAISPSSAEGISYALKSACMLAESVECGLDGYLERYTKQMQSIKTNLLLKQLKSPAMYNSHLRKMALSIPSPFNSNRGSSQSMQLSPRHLQQ